MHKSALESALVFAGIEPDPDRLRRAEWCDRTPHTRSNLIRLPRDWSGIERGSAELAELVWLQEGKDRPMVTRHRGRLGEGERLMTRAPRVGDGVRHPVTIKLAEFTRNGTIRRGQCVTIETVPASTFKPSA